MIVFLDDVRFVNIISEKFYGREIVLMNLSSAYSNNNIIDISNLITKVYITNYTNMPINMFVNSYEFDMQYLSAIFSNNELFTSFCNIIIKSFEGAIVIVLVQRDPYRDAVMETLIKIIQQRYGYNCWVIEDIDDIDIISDQQLNPDGVSVLDADINRYNELSRSGLVPNILGNLSIE